MDFAKLMTEARSDVLILDAEADAPDLAAMSAAHGLHFIHIHVGDVRNRTEFLFLLRQKLDFPDYFGSNWDALLDMMRDLTWLKAQKGIVILLSNMSAYARQDRAGFDMALDVLHDAAEFWRERTPERSLLIFV